MRRLSLGLHLCSCVNAGASLNATLGVQCLWMFLGFCPAAVVCDGCISSIDVAALLYLHGRMVWHAACWRSVDDSPPATAWHATVQGCGTLSPHLAHTSCT